MIGGVSDIFVCDGRPHGPSQRLVAPPMQQFIFPPCRCRSGYEAPEMAQEIDTLGYYSPLPAHDMWAFGLLLAEMLGIRLRQPHLDAMADDTSARAYAKSLLGTSSYFDVVSSCSAQGCNCMHDS